MDKHPEPKKGGAPAKHGCKVAKNDNSVVLRQNDDKPQSFAKETAALLSTTERDMQRSVHRAAAIAPEVKEAIAAMPEIASKGVELDALAAVPPGKAGGGKVAKTDNLSAFAKDTAEKTGTTERDIQRSEGCKRQFGACREDAVFCRRYRAKEQLSKLSTAPRPSPSRCRKQSPPCRRSRTAAT